MQADLFPVHPVPVAPDEISNLCAWLERRPGWHTAKEIGETLGLDDRKIRQIAEKSASEIVSGPGCPGYQHFNHCTAGELSRVAARLTSQGRSMLDRALKLRSKAHKALR